MKLRSYVREELAQGYRARPRDSQPASTATRCGARCDVDRARRGRGREQVFAVRGARPPPHVEVADQPLVVFQHVVGVAGRLAPRSWAQPLSARRSTKRRTRSADLSKSQSSSSLHAAVASSSSGSICWAETCRRSTRCAGLRTAAASKPGGHLVGYFSIRPTRTVRDGLRCRRYRRCRSDHEDAVRAGEAAVAGSRRRDRRRAVRCR